MIRAWVWGGIIVIRGWREGVLAVAIVYKVRVIRIGILLCAVLRAGDVVIGVLAAPRSVLAHSRSESVQSSGRTSG